MVSLVRYEFDDRGIRILDRAGSPWFLAFDVCAVLKMSRPKEAIAKLDVDERDVVQVGQQQCAVVSESGLYSLILRSRGATKEGSPAYRFRRWVCGEVLPTLRKSGSYQARDPIELLSDPKVLIDLLKRYGERLIAAEARVAAQAPKVEAFDMLAKAQGDMNLTDASKNLGITRKELIEFGVKNNWWYRKGGSGDWTAYQQRLGQGVLKHRPFRVDEGGGHSRLVDQLLITAKGLTTIALEMRSNVDLFRREMVA